MIYDINGNQLNSIYNLDGTSSTEAFDIDGVKIFPDVNTLKVMTYNVGRFTGINSQQAMQNAIISTYQPDIIGMQELGASTIPQVGQNMLSDYLVKQLSNHTNKIMMVTKNTNLENLVIADFVNQDPQDMSQWGETRAYMKADINMNGVNVCWINTHLCMMTTSIKHQQMAEIKALADQEEYCIITGDFNSYGLSLDSNDYVYMYKPFVDDGYNLANCSDDAGFTKTWTDSSTATSTEQMSYPTDSIITTANIDIVSVIFDPTKFSYLNGSAVDHIPICAELKIN